MTWKQAATPFHTVCPKCSRLTSTDTGYCRHCKNPLAHNAAAVAPFLAPPANYRWDLELGEDLEGRPIGIRLEALRQHILILGLTGWGKTTLVKRILYESSHSPIGFFVLDIEGEYGDLRSVGATVLGGPGSRNPLRLGLLDPGSTPKHLYVRLVSSMLLSVIKDEGWEVSPPMEVALERALQKAVRSGCGLEELQFIVEKAARNLPGGRQTAAALNVRLSWLYSPHMVQVLSAGDSPEFSPADRVVADLSWLSKISQRDASLVARIVLNKLYYSLVEMPLAERTRTLIVVEEAEDVIPVLNHRISPVTTVSQIMMHLRKRGAGMIVVTHSPSMVDKAVIKNAGNIAVFRLNHVEDVRLAAGMLGWERAASIIQGLEKGVFLLKTVDTPTPFLVRGKPPSYSDDVEMRILASIYKYPALGQRERRSLLGLDGKTYSIAVRRLEARGLVRRVTVYTGKGRPPILLQPKDMNPSVVHRYLMERIKRIAEKPATLRNLGIKVRARGPDLVIRSDDFKLCIEAETGTNIDTGKYSRFLEECNMVIIVGGSKKTLRRARRIASMLGAENRVRVVALSQLRHVLNEALSQLQSPVRIATVSGKRDPTPEYG